VYIKIDLKALKEKTEGKEGVTLSGDLGRSKQYAINEKVVCTYGIATFYFKVIRFPGGKKFVVQERITDEFELLREFLHTYKIPYAVEFSEVPNV